MSKTTLFGSDRYINCGEYGSHFVPPSLGDKGFFICQLVPKWLEKLKQEKEEVKKKNLSRKGENIMAKLFGKKKMTEMAPPAGSGMGIGSMMRGMPPIPKKAMPKTKRMPVMKRKGMALSKFAPAPKKMAKKVPKKGAFPF